MEDILSLYACRPSASYPHSQTKVNWDVLCLCAISVERICLPLTYDILSAVIPRVPLSTHLPCPTIHLPCLAPLRQWITHASIVCWCPSWEYNTFLMQKSLVCLVIIFNLLYLAERLKRWKSVHCKAASTIRQPALPSPSRSSPSSFSVKDSTIYLS